jgi:hypothetical protein
MREKAIMPKKKKKKILIRQITRSVCSLTGGVKYYS